MHDDTDLREDSAQGGAGRKALNGLLLLVIVALVAGIGYLLSERNARRYFLVSEADTYVIKRGRFLPRGEQPYRPEDPRLAAAYAVIDAPPWGHDQVRETFEERADLDVALAQMMLQWTRRLVGHGTREASQIGMKYLERVRKLPSITSAQQEQVEKLARDLAFFQARSDVEDAVVALQSARGNLERATKAGGTRSQRAREALPTVTSELERLVELQAVLGGGPSSKPDEAPSQPEAGAAADPSDAEPPAAEIPAPELVAPGAATATVSDPATP